MFSYIWPIGLVVISNVVYQVCAKSVPDKMDPFASLVITYVIAAAASASAYFIAHRKGSFIAEIKHLNWAPVVLGIVIVGLEVGFIYAYKAGWPVSTAQIVSSSFLAVCLLLTGFFLYQEQISVTKIVGVMICLVGLYFINK